MHEEMEDFIEHLEPLESDEEYEFDACRFFDFTRPEFDYEIEEAERWFEISGDYPLSPFFLKLNLDELLSVEVVPSSSNRNCSTPKKNAKGPNKHVLQGTEKAKTKPCDKLYLSRSSTLMKPTASHLAKQNKILDNHSSHECTRLQRGSSMQSPTMSDNLATKRQKLEIGYLKKIAQLKHGVSLSHKSSKKLTVPKEPELETLLRAQRRSSKNSSISSESEKRKPNECISKARSLNRKIVQAPPLPLPKKSKPHVPKTQELSTVNKASKSPPIEQFSKLSLGSDNKANEDSFGSLEHELWRNHAKTNQCGGHIRVH